MVAEREVDLYVLSQAAQGPTLSTYDFDTTLMVLTSTNNATTIGQVQAGGVNPQTGQPTGATVSGTAAALALSPGGSFAYVAVSTPDNIAVVQLAPDGSTTVLGNLSPGGPSQTCIAAYPGGKYVWATNGASGTVNEFTLSSTNALTLNPSPIQVGQVPIDMTLDIVGSAAWVDNVVSGDINMFSVQGTSGTLTSLGATGGACQQNVGTTAWMGTGFPDNVVPELGIAPVAQANLTDRTYAYVLNLGVPGTPPQPPFVTIYQILDGSTIPPQQQPPPTSAPPSGTLYPVLLPTAAVPAGQNPFLCGITPGIFQIQPTPPIYLPAAGRDHDLLSSVAHGVKPDALRFHSPELDASSRVFGPEEASPFNDDENDRGRGRAARLRAAHDVGGASDRCPRARARRARDGSARERGAREGAVRSHARVSHARVTSAEVSVLSRGAPAGRRRRARVRELRHDAARGVRPGPRALHQPGLWWPPRPAPLGAPPGLPARPSAAVRSRAVGERAVGVAARALGDPRARRHGRGGRRRVGSPAALRLPLRGGPLALRGDSRKTRTRGSLWGDPRVLVVLR